jgi:hypothetical protein
MIYWSYKICEDTSFSENIKRLTQILSFKNLEFITTDIFDSSDVGNFERYFNITDVQMIGDSKYLKDCLSNTTKELISLLEILMKGEESLETKIYEIQKARCFIKEFFLSFNYRIPGMIDSKFVYNLHNFQLPLEKNCISIRYIQGIFSNEAKAELQYHQEVRHGYMEILDSHLAIELDKLFLLPLEAKIEKESINDEKEKQLLEVWVALKESGFMSYLGENKMAISQQRKIFFELFNLTDRKYEDRNKHLKIMKGTKAVFLKHLTNLIENYSK